MTDEIVFSEPVRDWLDRFEFGLPVVPVRFDVSLPIAEALVKREIAGNKPRQLPAA